MTFSNGKRKWEARSSLNGVKVNLGVHDTEIEAAKTYDKWAKINFKTPNFFESETPSLDESDGMPLSSGAVACSSRAVKYDSKKSMSHSHKKVQCIDCV